MLRSVTCMCVSEMHASTFHFLHALFVIYCCVFCARHSHDGWNTYETHINMCQQTERDEKESEIENWSETHIHRNGKKAKVTTKHKLGKNFVRPTLSHCFESTHDSIKYLRTVCFPIYILSTSPVSTICSTLNNVKNTQ